MAHMLGTRRFDMCMRRLFEILGPLTFGLPLIMFAASVPGESEISTNTSVSIFPRTANFEKTLAKAATNDVEAKLTLGWMYDEGVGAPQSANDSFGWWLE